MSRSNQVVAIPLKAPDVFLCHNKEDKPEVKLVANRLIESGIVPWLDEWNLIPGEPWQEEIEGALDSCRTCAVFVGPSGFGPWQNEEMRVALSRRVNQSSQKFRVIPVLLPGAKRDKKQKLPAFLSRATWVEFNGSLNDTESFRLLISGIKGVKPGPTATVSPTRWVLVLEGVYEDFDKARAEAVAKHLQEILQDSHLTITSIREGSIAIHIKGSRRAFQLLESLFSQGKLLKVAGLKVLDVQEEGTVELRKNKRRHIRRILFVDDHEVLARLSCEIFEMQGFKAQPAYSAAEAIEIFKRESFDLLITDFRMEHMNGVELAREIHLIDPGIPVIVVTGYGPMDAPNEIDEWFEKENLFPQLLEAISKINAAAETEQSGLRDTTKRSAG